MSGAFFSGPVVKVQGLPWCQTDPRTVGLAAATAKILCEGHNSDLSELDVEIGNYIRVVRDHLRLSEARSQPRFMPFHVQNFNVNARRLERWLLKVLLNLSYESHLTVGLDGETPGMPSLAVVQMCFGTIPFPAKSGMYVASYNGMSMEMGEVVQYSPLVRSDHRIVGGFFMVAGVRFFLALDPAGLPSSLADVPNLEHEWRATELRWRFREIKTEMNHRLSHVIRFNW